MLHLGDIRELDGGALPVVDCITGGSPCQDLSVAGKREGLSGERSSLFLEQARIVKEMRENDRSTGRAGFLVRPRFMVWENVPGAFSSNKGRDFQRVLTEIVRIAEPEAPDVPMPEKGGWPHSGCLYDELGRWSVAWRLHDAQFWGVPQRRKRIALVADFGGLTASEVLFERQSLRWHLTEGGEAREGAAEGAGGGVEGAVGYGETGVGYWQGGIQTLRAEGENRPSRPLNVVVEAMQCANPWDAQTERVYTGDGAWHSLSGNSNGGQSRDAMLLPTAEAMERTATYGISAYESNAMKSDNPHSGIYKADTSRTLDSNGGNPACNQGGIAIVQGIHQNGNGEVGTSDTAYTLGTGSNASGRNAPLVFAQNQRDEVRDLRGVAGSLAAEPGMRQQTFVCESRPSDYTALVSTYQEVAGTLNPGAHPGGYNGQDAYNDMLVAAVDCRNGTENPDVNGTLQAKEQGFNLNSNNVCRQGQMVRRLTPLECTRLQGFPDGWVDIGDWTDSKGKHHKEADSPKYKALGNSIALPFWFWLLRRISAQYERPATLGSLFDGIGGFPLCWERCNGRGTALWASEIEEFCIAVTKRHFGDEGE